VNNQRRQYLRIFALAVVILGGLVVFGSSHKATTQKSTTRPTTKASTSSSASTLTAGGQPVPAAYQAKAKALGYYCPSWDSTDAQAASTICLPSDKK